MQAISYEARQVKKNKIGVTCWGEKLKRVIVHFVWDETFSYKFNGFVQSIMSSVYLKNPKPRTFFFMRIYDLGVGFTFYCCCHCGSSPWPLLQLATMSSFKQTVTLNLRISLPLMSKARLGARQGKSLALHPYKPQTTMFWRSVHLNYIGC